MKRNRSEKNLFLAFWIQHDPEKWAELKQIEIKILLQRIVYGWSYKRLAKVHNTKSIVMALVFEKITSKIEKCICPKVAAKIRQLDWKLSKGRSTAPEPIDFHLN